MLSRFADLFNTTVDYLLCHSNDPTPPTKHEAAGETLATRRADGPVAGLPDEATRSLLEFQEFIFEKYGQETD